MAPPTARHDLDALSRERQQYRAQVATALQEEADPLATYVRFVQWTEQHYTGDLLVHSGIVSLLEEATRTFRDDPSYKGDLRYFNLWHKYANLVEKPASVYRYLLDNDIGIVFAQLYIEYALALERETLRSKAQEIYRLGMKRRVRPQDKLRKSYDDFKERSQASLKPPPLPSTSRLRWPPNDQTLRQNPFRNYDKTIRQDFLKNYPASEHPASSSTQTPQEPSSSSSRVSSSSSSTVAPSTSSSPSGSAQSRYAVMLAPPIPGKRPEKLRFDLSLLWNDGTEYSIQEARARSKGLLGKKWAVEMPPPPIPSSSHLLPPPHINNNTATNSRLMKVDFNDDGLKTSRNFTGRKSLGLGGGAEPTVTINTKEALADVFGMYNSPERSVRVGAPLTGSKHAPVRRIDPVTPVPMVVPRMHERAGSNENAEVGSKTPGFKPFMDDHADIPLKTPTFRPFVDPSSNNGHSRVSSNENAGQAKTPRFQPFVDDGAEAITPGPPKFTPFVDNENPSKTPLPLFTPDLRRRALSIKDTSETPVPFSSNENASKSGTVFKPAPQDGNVFSKVFTPAASTHKGEQQPAFTVFGAQQNQSTTKERDVFSDERAENASVEREKQAAPAKKFAPFMDAGTPFRVFSRPPANENGGGGFVPRRGGLNGQNSNQNQSQSQNQPPLRLALGEQRLAFAPPPVQEKEPPSQGGDESWDDGQDPSGQEEQNPAEYDEEMGYDPEPEPEDGNQNQYPHRVPVMGRLGQYDVMTPITERTFEFTMSTRGLSVFATPTGDKGFGQRDANEAAEMLAEELRIEEEAEEEALTQRKSQPHAVFKIREPSLPPSIQVSEEENGPSGSFENLGLPPFRVSDGHTIPMAQSQANEECAGSDGLAEKIGSLSLSDVLSRASSFAPPNPCNPFDPSIMATLISLVPPDPGCELSNQDSNRLAELQKFARKRARRTSGNTSQSAARLADVDEGFLLSLGDRQFVVEDKLGEGGFGAVFSAQKAPSDEEDEEDEPEKLAIKVVKPRNLWEFHVLRRIHYTLPPHLRHSVIQPHDLFAFRDESFLILDLCPQGSLLDIVNRASDMKISQQGACLDELLVMFFSIELLRLVDGMHSAGFIHGDMKIDNCLVRLEDVPGGASAWSNLYQPSGEQGWSYKGVKLIDFGRTIDTRLFPAGQQFTGDWPTDARDCLEMREGRPWTYQTDYFGLAGIIYCLLFGKYIEKSSVILSTTPSAHKTQRYKLSTPFKRYWQGDIWTRLFDLLLNSSQAREDSSLPLCSEINALRGEMEAWLQRNCNRSGNALRQMLKKIEKFVESA
ncbi:hypothetical protein JAAARDRAFT_46770 [Jaapia argillacea MUCL 33604]|uniref:Protein kinase domain-containing protein n=1 Tax=Jaapia argillacea MUCL 33604 TaxID=933084 RepID=A0A067PWT3_9AGAM|nr:hypothetical protein JAAARDRAFT_46770 [Jaapia argillacea MUCL 33604]